EAYRALCAALQHLEARGGLRVLMVTSPEAGEGKTATAANIAVALAKAGKQVALVSADIRKPRLHRFLNASNQRGLCEILAGRSTLRDALVPTGVDGLALLPSGRVPALMAALLQQKAVRPIIEELSRVYELVITASSPTVAV